jgi:cytoskeletal protein RodZ
MVETVGRKLQKERVARKLRIEEVADATKIRAERIIDLEADEYGQFANLTYAKSFLAKYANYLGVDIQEELEHFQVAPSISLRDYQYLAPSVPKSIAKPREFGARAFRVPPLVVVLLVLILLVGVPFFSYMAIKIPRLRGGVPEGRAAQDLATVEAPTPSGAKPGASQSLAGTPQGTGNLAAGPGAPSSSSNQASASPSAQPTSRIEDGIEVRRALPVQQAEQPSPSEATSASSSEAASPSASEATSASPSEAPSASPSPAPATEPQTRLELRVLKRTWVKITKDEKGSEPVFDGPAAPEDQPIVVEGKRFWVRVQDKGAVEVLKNGQRVLNSSNNVVID